MISNYYHNDTSYLYNPLKLNDIKLIQIGKLYLKESAEVANHLHLEWFELTVVTGGEGYVYTNDVGTFVKTGDIYLSFPADVHKIVSSEDKPLRFDYLSFITDNEKFNNGLKKLISHLHAPDIRVFKDEYIETLLEMGINEITTNKQSYFEESLYGIVSQILVRTLRILQNTKPKIKENVSRAEMICYQVMHYIDTNVFYIKRLDQIANAFNYNYSYLSTLFKKTTGTSILEHYTQSKLKKATALITENKLSITEIAHLLNYSSVYAFSKAYKKQTGVPPTTNRK